MKVTIEQVAALRTASRSYRLTPSDDKAKEEMEIPAEEIVITWQKLDENPPTVTVTAPTGPDGWHLPIPQRPDWLVTLIRSGAPDWWMPGSGRVPRAPEAPTEPRRERAAK